MKARRKKALAKLQGKQTQAVGTDDTISKFMSLAVQVNTQTKYCVFLNIQGHVDWIDFKIAESKKSYNNELFSVKYLSLSKKDTRFEEIIYQLEYILEHGELDFDELQERHEYVSNGYTL